MRLRDIMNRDVETVTPADRVVVANELMWRKRFHHLVVMDDGKVVGVLSDTDLGGPQATEIPDDKPVRDYMTREVVAADPDMTVTRAIHIFQERNIHCLPILEGGKLVGIVTATDISQLAKRGISNSPTSQARVVAGPYPPLKRLAQSQEPQTET